DFLLRERAADGEQAVAAPLQGLVPLLGQALVELAAVRPLVGHVPDRAPGHGQVAEAADEARGDRPGVAGVDPGVAVGEGGHGVGNSFTGTGPGDSIASKRRANASDRVFTRASRPVDFKIGMSAIRRVWPVAVSSTSTWIRYTASSPGRGSGGSRDQGAG